MRRLLLLLLLLPSVAFADGSFSGCDYTNTTTAHGGATLGAVCADWGSVSLPSPMTLYGIQFFIKDVGSHTAPFDTLYYQDVNSTDTSCHSIPLINSTGLVNITLPVPLSYNAGAIPQVFFYHDSFCTLATDTTVWYAQNPPAGQYNYKVFYWSSGFSGFTQTAITSVTPYNGQTVATDTPLSLEAIGWVQGWKAGTNVVFSYITQYDSALGVGVSPSLNTTTITVPVPNFAEVPNLSFDVSATSSPPSTVGRYLLTTSVTQPSLSFFGFTIFTSTLVSTSTFFIASTTTNADQLFANFMAQSANFNTTASSSASLNDCLGFNMGLCMTYLFLPSAASLSQYSTLGSNLTSKPPLGYLKIAQTLLSNATTTTASTTPQGIGVVAGIFAPLITGLSLLLWFMLVLWMFHRLRNFNFQT